MDPKENKKAARPPSSKKKKRGGPLRLEAIIPVFVVVAICSAYFHWFFDGHLRRALEWIGTQANGAEVNIRSLRTSFFGAYIEIGLVELTDKNKPARNLFQVGKIRFDLSWDALLRAKVVVEDASILDIEALVPRKRPGFVVPPSDPKNSVMSRLQSKVINQIKSQYEGNVFGDIAQLLEGTKPEDLLKNLEAELKTSARIKVLEEEFKSKEQLWKQRLKDLPKSSDLKEIENRIKNIKVGNDPIAIQKAIKEISDIVKDIEGKAKVVKTAGKDAEAEVKSTDAAIRQLEDFVKQDLEDLQQRLKITNLDPKDFAMKMFGAQFAGRLAEIRKYSEIAKQYMPPKKSKEQKKEDEIIPPPRTVGKTYHFGKPRGYPIFWLKKAKISSRSGGSEFGGDLSGALTDVSSSPEQVANPTVLTISGNFPRQEIQGFKSVLTLDHRGPISTQSLDLSIARYPISSYRLVQSGDVDFSVKQATAKMSLSASLKEETIGVDFFSEFSGVMYEVNAKSKALEEILSSIVKDVPKIDINAKAQGSWDSLSINLDSNLGRELGNAVKRQIDAKVTEAKKKVKEFVEGKISDEKTKLVQKFESLKTNLLGDLKLREKDLENLKKTAQNELKVKGKASDQLKKSGQKALDDLKKKFKF